MTKTRRTLWAFACILSLAMATTQSSARAADLDQLDIETVSDKVARLLPPLAPGEHTLNFRIDLGRDAAALTLPTLAFTETLNVDASAEEPSAVTLKGRRNPRIVLRLYQAFAEGDLDTILEIIHPDVVWIESEGIPYGGTFVGRDAVFEGVFGNIAAEWDNFIAAVDEVIDGGKQVVTVGRDSGTYKATGKSMEAPTISVWTLNHKGQVFRFLQVIDPQAVLSAVNP